MLLNIQKIFANAEEAKPADMAETPETEEMPASGEAPGDASPDETTADAGEAGEPEERDAAGDGEEAATEEAPVDEHDAEANNPSMFPVGEPMTGDFAKFFSGKTYLNHLVPRGGAVINMTFEPGCRSNWHIHHNGGQVLLVTGGAGWYQEEGKEPRPLRPGDIVRVPAEIKHWHGAAKDSWMSHLLVPIAVPGASNAFLEAVEDKEYDALPASKEDGADDSLMSHLGAKLFGKP